MDRHCGLRSQMVMARQCEVWRVQGGITATLTGKNVIGVHWPEQLDPVTTNWKQQNTEFQVGGVKVKLQGDSVLGMTKISLKTTLRTLQKEGGRIMVELNQLDGKGEEHAINIEREAPSYLHSTLQVNSSHKCSTSKWGFHPAEVKSPSLSLKQVVTRLV